VYLACSWTLFRRKTGAFKMSFGRVCGVKRVFAALFRRKTDVFATRLRCMFHAITAKRAILTCHAVVARAHTHTHAHTHTYTCHIVGVATDASIVTLLYDIPCQNTDSQCHHPIGQWAETRVNMSRHVRVHVVNICERPLGQ